MESLRTIGEIEGIVAPPREELDKQALADCPERSNPHKISNGHTIAHCALLSEKAGKGHSMSVNLCKVCQANGGPTFAENAFLRGFACQCAFMQTIAGPTATEAKQPPDAEIEKAIDTIVEYRGKDVAAGFVEALVFHESVTPEKGAALVDQYALAASAKS